MSELLQTSPSHKAYDLYMIGGPEKLLGDGSGGGVAVLDHLVPADAPSNFVAVDAERINVPKTQERLDGPFAAFEYAKQTLHRGLEIMPNLGSFTVRVLSANPLSN